MKTETIQKAVELARKLKHVFVATADERGVPHVAAAGKVGFMSKDLVTVGAWFCPGTITNLHGNRHISIVVWDAVKGTGYQLLGEVEEVEELAFLDGYVPEIEGSPPSPQVERDLHVRVNRVIVFSHAPHSDLEE